MRLIRGRKSPKVVSCDFLVVELGSERLNRIASGAWQGQERSLGRWWKMVAVDGVLDVPHLLILE